MTEVLWLDTREFVFALVVSRKFALLASRLAGHVLSAFAFFISVERDSRRAVFTVSDVIPICVSFNMRPSETFERISFTRDRIPFSFAFAAIDFFARPFVKDGPLMILNGVFTFPLVFCIFNVAAFIVAAFAIFTFSAFFRVTALRFAAFFAKERLTSSDLTLESAASLSPFDCTTRVGVEPTLAFRDFGFINALISPPLCLREPLKAILPCPFKI